MMPPLKMLISAIPVTVIGEPGKRGFSAAELLGIDPWFRLELAG
jgi:hypothetical protein